MTVAVVIPAGVEGDPWRRSALEHVFAWYVTEFGWTVTIGRSTSPEWSKGEAVADGVMRAGSASVLVLADADSFITPPGVLAEAVDLVEHGVPWAVPHRNVYRLKADETERLIANPKSRPRLGHLARPVYVGPVGGGITVVSREAFERVGGVDRRFLGWGGEDLAFGWALETLVGPAERLSGSLVHLWHPHPAPNLRGSEASENLVARYRSARGVVRRMADVVAGREWIPAEPLPHPVRFRMTANRTALRLASGDLIRFAGGIFETSDPDVVEQIRAHRHVREERTR